MIGSIRQARLSARVEVQVSHRVRIRSPIFASRYLAALGQEGRHEALASQVISQPITELFTGHEHQPVRCFKQDQPG